MPHIFSFNFFCRSEIRIMAYERVRSSGSPNALSQTNTIPSQYHFAEDYGKWMIRKRWHQQQQCGRHAAQTVKKGHTYFLATARAAHMFGELDAKDVRDSLVALQEH